MRKIFLVLCILCATTVGFTAPPSAQPPTQQDWRARLRAELPLLGHRNWILVVDSAYPLQSTPGVETIETNQKQLDVVRAVLDAVHRTPHVRADISMDAELPDIPDADAPGASAYRAQIATLLKDHTVHQELHDSLISLVDDTGRKFHILVLKTTMTIPYSSVFIRLDCNYWSADAEQRMRARMSTAKP
jgi:hypothetical protein